MKKIIWILVAGLCSYMLSCDSEKKDNELESLSPLSLTGSVVGKVIDRCTGAPIANVKVSIAGVSSSTTNSNGEFVFRNVPITTDDTQNGYGTFWDNYTVLFDFTAFNKSKADSLQYPDYDEQDVDVVYTDLNDGDNAGSGGTEAGSGSDTPIQGIVSHVTLYAGKTNSTINGQVVDNNYQPVQGAIVYLKNTIPNGSQVLVAQTSTNVSGNFTFDAIEDGEDFVVEAYSTDRSMYGTRNVSLECSQDGSIRSQVSTENIVLGFADNVPPRIISISPENSSDASTSATIIFKFSEPIKQNAFTNITLPKGHGTIMDSINLNYLGLKKVLGPMQFTLAWNSAFDQLTLTPTSPLTPNARYTVTFTGGPGKLRDNAGNLMINNTVITGDFYETLSFTTQGNTTAPATPGLVRDTVLNASAAVNWNGGNVRLRWTQDESTVQVRHFDLYKKIGNGAFDRIATNIKRLDTTVTVSSTDLIVGDATEPRAAQTVQYAVLAISTNLVVSTMSAPVIIADRALPTLATAVINNPGGSPNFDYVYIRMSEPVTQVITQGATFSITDNNASPANVRQIEYLGFDNNVLPGGTGYKIRITVDNGSVVAGESLSLTGLFDLAGNGIDINANSFTF